MSTIRDFPPEPDPVEITRRLRSYMGDKKISRKALALAAGIGRTPLGAKLDDQTQFTLTEILAIARALGKSWVWVMTGEDDGQDPDPEDGIPAPLGSGPRTGGSLLGTPRSTLSQPTDLYTAA